MTTNEPAPERAAVVLEAGFGVGPGLEITVTEGLPWELNALRPDTFSFADPEQWVIHEFMINTASQLARPDVPALELATSLHLDRCKTIQRRMQFSMRASHRGASELVFRCEISGPAVRVSL